MEESSNYVGKLRVILHKLDDGYEVLNLAYFDDVLIGDTFGILEEEINSCGLDRFDADLTKVLEGYAIDTVVEILADVHVHWIGEGEDADSQCWLTAIRHTKLESTGDESIESDSLSRCFVEGNKGGDFIDMTKLMGEKVHLEVGCCCVKTQDIILPVTDLVKVLSSDDFDKLLLNVKNKEEES